jgi:membrane protease YdiL (CAAX protease family)
MAGESNATRATPRPGSRALPAPPLDAPLVLFFVLTFAGTWALWLVSGALSRPAPRQVYDWHWLVAQLGVFVPALAALAVSVPAGPRFRRSSLLTLLAVFVPVTVLGGWIAGTAATSIPAIGWRGFALPRLLERHGPSTAIWLLTVAWALWHAPIDLTHGFGLQGPGALVVRLLWTWPVTVIFTFFFLRARGSLLAPLALHTSFNVLSDIGAAAFEPAIQVLAVVNVAVAVPLSLRMERPPYWPRDASTWRRGGPGIGGRGSLRPANRSGGC